MPGRSFLRAGPLALSLVLTISGLSAPTALAAPPSNDEYSSATVLPTAKLAQASGTMVDATSNRPGDADVWYTWTAPSSGPVEIVMASSTTAPEPELYLDGTEAEFNSYQLDLPPDFRISNDCDYPPRSYCNDWRVQAGQTYRIRAFTCVACGYPQAPFTLRVIQDDVGPDTVLARRRVNRDQGYVLLFPRATDPQPSVGGVVVQCKVGNRRFRRCEKRSQTQAWRVLLIPPARTGTHIKRFLVQMRGEDANHNLDPTPLKLRVAIKQRCSRAFFGGAACTILRVRVRRL